MVLWGSFKPILLYQVANRLLFFMIIMFAKLLFFKGTVELGREHGNRANENTTMLTILVEIQLFLFNKHSLDSSVDQFSRVLKKLILTILLVSLLSFWRSRFLEIFIPTFLQYSHTQLIFDEHVNLMDFVVAFLTLILPFSECEVGFGADPSLRPRRNPRLF